MFASNGSPGGHRWPPPRRDGGAGGFTLLEVLIAFAVLSMVAAVVLQVFSQGLRTIDAGERHGIAALHAQSILAASGHETPLAAGETVGRFGDGFVWLRRIEIDPVADVLPTDAPVVPYRITVTVAWDRAPPAARVTLTTLRLVGVEQSDAPVPAGEDQ